MPRQGQFLQVVDKVLSGVDREGREVEGLEAEYRDNLSGRVLL